MIPFITPHLISRVAKALPKEPKKTPAELAFKKLTFWQRFFLRAEYYRQNKPRTLKEWLKETDCIPPGHPIPQNCIISSSFLWDQSIMKEAYWKKVTDENIKNYVYKPQPHAK